MAGAERFLRWLEACGPFHGEVAEWSKANDSKSFEGKPSVGSNPTLSVCLCRLPAWSLNRCVLAIFMFDGLAGLIPHICPFIA